MKNLMKNYLLIIAVFFTIATSAMDDGLDVRIGVNAKTIDLILQNSDGNIEVTIIDSKGFELYNEKFQGSVFAKKFDFETLPNGDYFFEIEGQTRIKILPFSIAFNYVNFDSKSIYYKPIVRMNNDEIIITKFAIGNESLDIYLLDEKLNLLYTEKLSGRSKLGRILDISGLLDGEYKLVMKSENRIFEQIMKKKN